MEPRTWKLEELAERAGVSARTVRYYVQRGLVPAPQFRGRDTAYGEEHLLRLKAIRALQKRFVSLDAIEAELKGADVSALQKLAGGDVPELLEAPTVAPQTVSPAPALNTAAPGEDWKRIVLAHGLELHLSDRADAATREHAVELLGHAKRLGLLGGSHS